MQYSKSKLLSILRLPWTRQMIRDLVDSLWRDPVEPHEPVTIADGSTDYLSIDENQELSIDVTGLGGTGSGEENVQSDWAQTDNTADDYIKNKPTIPTNPIQVTGLTLDADNWALVSGLYEYDLSNANITANSIVEVIPETAYIAIVKAAEILPENDSSAGSVKIYSTNEPTDDIGVSINIFEATT